MTKPTPMRTALLLGLASLALASCGKKTPPELPPVPEGSGQTDPGYDNGAGTGDGYGDQSGDAIQRAFLAAVTSDRIFFALNDSSIDAEDQSILASQAQWLQANPRVRIVIEGHTDERGTREYNLALGERRANAAKAYLASMGVDPNRITTLSYGKERPQAYGSDEGAWAQNRRAVTVTLR